MNRLLRILLGISFCFGLGGFAQAMPCGGQGYVWRTTDGHWIVSDWWCKGAQTWVTTDTATALGWCYNASMDESC